MAKDPSRHYETPDPTPVALPSGFKRPETLQEQIQRLVRTQLSAVAAAHEFETFDEADDFDVDDDPPDPSTPYEPDFDPVLGREITPADIVRRKDEYARETEKRVDAAKTRAGKKTAAEATPPAPPPAAAGLEPKEPAS